MLCVQHQAFEFKPLVQVLKKHSVSKGLVDY